MERDVSLSQKQKDISHEVSVQPSQAEAAAMVSSEVVQSIIRWS